MYDINCHDMRETLYRLLDKIFKLYFCYFICLALNLSSTHFLWQLKWPELYLEKMSILRIWKCINLNRKINKKFLFPGVWWKIQQLKAKIVKKRKGKLSTPSFLKEGKTNKNVVNY